jgi:hypothetical protein
VSGRRVPGLAGVDDDHRPALAAELQGGGQSSGGTTDHGDIAVALDGTGDVGTHGHNGKVHRTGPHGGLQNSQDW